MLLLAFGAGMLTALAPCVLPLLPVIIGGSAQGTHRRPWIMTLSLGVSVTVFTLLLKVSTAFINIPQSAWNNISGAILLFFGVTALFPATWVWLSTKLKLQSSSDHLLEGAATKKGLWGDIVLGASLGPVFSSCSPTYFVILATILPQSFSQGLAALIAYSAGLSFVLLGISVLGQALVKRLRFAANPEGWFRRGLGVIFILVGLAIIFRFDKTAQTYLLDHGYFDTSTLEQQLQNVLDQKDEKPNPPLTKTELIDEGLYHEITAPSGFVNTDGITIGELVGKKVIIVDFMTYSCINCIRTFPYLNDWYKKYHDKGLEIIGIHTPEFAFEHKQENVAAAMAKFGITFPIVLDNDYGTWNAYGNQYWPRKYIIDLNGHIVFDHIGEGGYAETEAVIRQLLGLSPLTEESGENTVGAMRTSPETYFGAGRNHALLNGIQGQESEQILSATDDTAIDTLSLVGDWNFVSEYAESLGADDAILYRFHARDVFFVASALEPLLVRVTVDGLPVDSAHAGTDVTFDENGNATFTVSEERLYSILTNFLPTENHLLRLEPIAPGLKAYTFTFGG